MLRLPSAIRRLVEALERLPGIGPKTAQRLTFYLLHVPQVELDQLSQAVGNLKRQTRVCSICFNTGEADPCEICSDLLRDKGVICVVEEPMDVVAIEQSGGYKGLYHVLHGVISPLDNIGPNQLHVRDLLPRLKNGVREVILATNPTMEGEATAMYIANIVREGKAPASAKATAGRKKAKVKITRLGRGLPSGGDIEYADETTLTRAFEGRRE
ncbi:MAG: recombination protein RecR, partial [Candidatus Chisholmbacteria bacterium]|nr:recombination protein RecR [Candidatus Chisholmbacteria bacterium]